MQNKIPVRKNRLASWKSAIVSAVILLFITSATPALAQDAKEKEKEKKEVDIVQLRISIETDMARGEIKNIVQTLRDASAISKGNLEHEKIVSDLLRNWEMADDIFSRFIESLNGAKTQQKELIELKPLIGVDLVMVNRLFNQDTTDKYFTVFDKTDMVKGELKDMGIFANGVVQVSKLTFRKIEWTDLSEASIIELIKWRMPVILEEELKKPIPEPKAVPGKPAQKKMTADEYKAELQVRLSAELAALALCMKLPVQTKELLDDAKKTVTTSGAAKIMNKSNLQNIEKDHKRIEFNLGLLNAEMKGFENDLKKLNGPESMMVRVNNTFVDKYEYPNRKGVYPIRMVTWSEARWLCQRKNKRLCYISEWQTACEGPEKLTWPYGKVARKNMSLESRLAIQDKQKDKIIPTPCNTFMYEFNKKDNNEEPFLRNAGTALHKIGDDFYKDCVSPYGAMDMSGSLSEFVMVNPEDKAEAAEGQAHSGQVPVVGGHWLSKTDYAKCKTIYWYDQRLPKNTGIPLRFSTVGFRCCVDIPGAARIVDGGDGPEILFGTDSILGLDWSGDNKWAVLTTLNGELAVFNTLTWDSKLLERAGNKTNFSSKFTPDSKNLVTIYADSGKISIRNVGNEWKVIKEIPGDKDIKPISAIFTADGKKMLVLSFDESKKSGLVRIWDTSDWTVSSTIFEKYGNENLREIAVNPKDDSMVAVLTDIEKTTRAGKKYKQGYVHIWSLKDNKLVTDIECDENSMASLSFSFDGKYMATIAANGSIKLWLTKNWSEARSVARDLVKPQSIRFSPDGKNIAVSGENAFYLWDFEKQIFTDLYKGWGKYIAFSPDGKFLLLTLDNPKENKFGVKAWPVKVNAEK